MVARITPCRVSLLSAIEATGIASYTAEAGLLSGAEEAGVFSTLEVDADTICGSISVYLLISGVFASIYTILVTLDPSAFLIPGPPADPDYSLGPDRLMTYFSLITITTVGYGDVTPQSEFARSLSNFEALIGQLFLTVLVARLVGRQLSGVGGRGNRGIEETGN